MASDPAGRRDDRLPPSGISLQTLLIASLASAAASYAVAHVWGPGTLVGAAAAPVIIAVVSEILRRPLRTMSDNAKALPMPSGTPRLRLRRWLVRWRWAIITGLAAFAIVVVVYTVPDLLAGSSITGNGQPTTFFGGPAKGPNKPVRTPMTTTTTHTTVTRTTTETTTPTTHTSSTTTTTRPAGPATTADTSTTSMAPRQ